MHGYNPAIRLERSYTWGYAPGIWDLVASEDIFIADRTCDTIACQPFIISQGAPTYSFYMAGTSGNIGMGIHAPDSKLNLQTGGDLVTPQPDTVLHLENDDEDGFGTDLTITAAKDKSSRIHFSNPEDPDDGSIYYYHKTHNMTFVSFGKTRMQLGPGAGTTPEVEFFGDVSVTGSLSKGGGGFKIDHPLEPENKYLSHSFVESPGMMNVYNGNVELDDKGEAWIQMPDYFGPHSPYAARNLLPLIDATIYE